MSKAVLFLDFDDVVNFFSSRNAYRKNNDAFGYLARVDIFADDGYFYSVNWSKELVKKLNDAKDKYDFTWLWLTTWKHNTKHVDRTLDTHGDGYLDWDSDSGFNLSTPTSVVSDARDARKYDTLLDYLRTNPSPFIWVDDSATRKYNKDDFVGVLDVPHLVVTPDAKYGLLKPDLDAMVSFLDSLGD